MLAFNTSRANFIKKVYFLCSYFASNAKIETFLLSKFIHPPPVQTLPADSRTLNDTFMKIYVAARENISAQEESVTAELVLLQSARKYKFSDYRAVTDQIYQRDQRVQTWL